MKRIITIGREFGSGGRELGRRIAEKLEIAYYDQEIITEIAKRTALSEEYIRQIEEMRPILHFPIRTGHRFYLTSEPIIQGPSTVFRRRVLPQGVCSKRPPGQSPFLWRQHSFLP